jgi:hypothetical protein
VRSRHHHRPGARSRSAVVLGVLAGALGVLAGALAACSPEPSVRFVDGTAEAGIDFDHENGKSDHLFLIESIPAGAIFFDAEGDGDPDVYFLNGAFVAGAPPEGAPLDELWRNDGRGHFAEATEGTGLGDPRYSIGVSGADYDNDGDTDLYVTNFEDPNALFRNDGGLSFTDVAREAGVEGTASFDAPSAFADLDNDGFLDLYVGNYNDHSKANNIQCKMKRRDGKGIERRYCPVERYTPIDDVLYRSRGDGTFEDVSVASGIAGHPARSFGIACADYDDDGDQDIFVASDNSPNLFFENQGGFRFEEIAAQAGVGVDKDGDARGGMGIATGDLDFDGKLDAAITNFTDEVNGFYHNRGKNLFAAWEYSNGTAVPSRPFIGWGIEFFDADLDTDLDCLLVNGHFIDNEHLFREPMAGYEQPKLFYLNDGQGNFTEATERAGPGLASLRVSRGLATADVDGDGDLDALVTNLQGQPELLRNESPREGEHWLLVRTVGRKSNRDGIGARLIARLSGRELVREVHSGQTCFSQSDMRVHFGLGTATVVPELEVRWPSGALSRIADVAADQVLEVVEP